MILILSKSDEINVMGSATIMSAPTRHYLRERWLSQQSVDNKQDVH